MTPNMHINALREQVLALEAEIERLQAAIAWTREVRPGKNAESGGAIVHMTWDQFNTMRAIARAAAMTREPDIVARLRECKQWLPVPVGLASEAADEIEHLKAQIIEDCTCHNQMVENLGIEIERLRATGLELLAVAERLSPAEHSLARVQIDKARTALERKP